MRHTSLEWWENVLRNPTLLLDWLTKQYHGEITATERITLFRDTYCTDENAKQILTTIAGEESRHAKWVETLLTARGLTPKVLDKTERYWEQTLPNITNFETGAAIAAHAEKMRLERIRVIVDHPSTPADIREVFQKILPEEIGHEWAFSHLAGIKALTETEGAHELGLEALGLTI